jgi:hypothetical protein
MENKKVVTSLFLFGLLGSSRGEPVSEAGVYLETEPECNLVAFQETGESGSVTFAHLDKGVYKIYIDIPRQTGKLEVKETIMEDNLQVGYHSEKKLYFFHELQGYFTVRFSGLSKLANSNITPMHELETNKGKARIVIGKLEVDQKYGSLTLKLAAHTQKKFHKLIDKYANDAGMAVIRK